MSLHTSDVCVTQYYGYSVISVHACVHKKRHPNYHNSGASNKTYMETLNNF